MAASNSLGLGQVFVPDKANEIMALPGLLRTLELGGCIGLFLDLFGDDVEVE